MRESPRRTPLAIARFRCQMRQKDAAAQIGCSVSTIQKMELGKIPLSRPIAEKASRIFGVKLM